MNRFAVILGMLGVAAAFAATPRADWKVLASGDTKGYLSPCGCTYPMSGGIKRRIGAVRGETTLYVDNGGLVDGVGRQDRLKAETLIQVMVDGGVAAINFTPAEARFGRGSILAWAALAKNRFVSTQVQDDGLGIAKWIEKGPFLIGGASARGELLTRGTESPVSSIDEAVTLLVKESQSRGTSPVLLLSAPLEEATRVAETFPTLKLIVYSSPGDPARKELKVGTTLLVSPGDRGRSLVGADWQGMAFSGYSVLELTPDWKDDPQTAQVYAFYLRRVDRGNLLDEVPRVKGDPFAGTAACISCHADAGKVWNSSAHSHALKTLEKEGHARDPDCVSCHVVGLDSTEGFKSREATPNLADVGCESCHGAGADHSAKPYLERMGKVGAQSCVPCHNAENSPRFDFESYWKKIQH